MNTLSGEAIEELAKINWNSERREKKEASSECWRIPTLRGREEREGRGPPHRPKKENWQAMARKHGVTEAKSRHFKLESDQPC